MRDQPPDSSPARARRLVFRIAVGLSLLIILCPPYTSLKGTEYAFVFVGPEWSQKMGEVGTELGLVARLNWKLLVVELAAVWTGALVIRPLIGRARAVPVLIMALVFAWGPPAQNPRSLSDHAVGQAIGPAESSTQNPVTSS